MGTLSQQIVGIPATRQVLLIVMKPPVTGSIEDYVLAATPPSAATIMVNGASADQRLALPTNIVIVPTMYVTMRAPTSMVKTKPPKRASAEQQIFALQTNIVIVPTIYVTMRAPTPTV